MSNKIIDEILLAEKQSEQIVSKAKQEAIKSLTQAEEKSLNIKAEAQQKYKEDLNSYTQEYEQECKMKYQESLSQYYKTAEDLERNAQENMQKAVEKIIKNID